MNVLVDTPVLSLALRQGSCPQRRRSTDHAGTGRVDPRRAGAVSWVVRQELLSGIREEERFRKLRDYLRAFDDPQLEPGDYDAGGANEQSLPQPRNCGSGN